MSVVPISKETLMYGSDDGGLHVHSDNQKLNDIMRSVALRLNLKPHTVGLKQKTTIYGPGDVEAHEGYDGRFYVVDVGRAMPPEAPLTLQQVKEEPRSVFYRFLRPEWVRDQPKPLCSDGNTIIALLSSIFYLHFFLLSLTQLTTFLYFLNMCEAFTCWDCSTPEEVQKNQEEVLEATMKLYNQGIPKFAAELDAKANAMPSGRLDAVMNSFKEVRFLSIYHSTLL